MSGLIDFQVSDLTSTNSKLIFVLESPHIQEVKLGYPAAGDTGINMSRVLFKLDTPLGKLLKDGVSLPIHLSLINCSRLPLQKSCYGGTQLSDSFTGFLEIHDIEDSSTPSLKMKIKQKLRSSIGRQAVENFKHRLLHNIEASKNTKLIVCGVIAQCFFEEATSLECKFRKPTKVIWHSHAFSVYYEFHPSSKSKKWASSSNMVGLMNYVS